MLPQAFTINDLFVEIDSTTSEVSTSQKFCWSPYGQNGENFNTWCRGRRDFLLDTVEKNMGVLKQVKREYSRASEIKMYNDIMENSPHDLQPLPYQKKILEMGPPEDEED